MPQLLITSLLSFFVSLFTLLLIYWLSKNNHSIFVTFQIKTKQTIHEHPVSRIGGLGIYIGFVFSIFISMEANRTSSIEQLLPLLLTLPFLTGFFEDI